MSQENSDNYLKAKKQILRLFDAVQGKPLEKVQKRLNRIKEKNQTTLPDIVRDFRVTFST